MTLVELASSGVVLADGAMGTYGFALDQGLGPVPSLWPIERPDLLEVMHAEYARVGARLLLTCTFGASRGWLAQVRQEAWIADINRNAVAAARHAAGPDAFVAGDIGPAAAAGARGGLVVDYIEQIEVLVDSGVDAILFETIQTANDLRHALDAASRVRVPVPVIASMTFNDALRSPDGVSPAEFAGMAVDLGASIVGVNCCDGPRTVCRAVEQIAPTISVPVFAKPSAGLPCEDGSYPVTVPEFAEWCLRLVDAGARIVGGCCGTTPSHIAACRELLGTSGFRSG